MIKISHILPQLVAEITRHPRHKVDNLQWNRSSIVYNIFRLHELIFWRRSGSNPHDILRSEALTYILREKDSVTIYREFFSWESLLMYAEHCIKNAFELPKLNFRFVPAPQLAFVTGPYSGKGQGLFGPIFSFAIAFDTTDFANVPSGGSTTVSHTTSSSNPVMFIYANDSDGDTVTGVTYAGAALTQVNKGLRSDGRESYLYVKNAPATGTNNAVVTASGSPGALYNIVITYSGAAQTGQPDSSNVQIASTSSSPFTLSSTVVLPNCWFVVALDNNGGTITSTTPTTGRNTGALGNFYFDSNASVSTGTNTGSWAFTGTLQAYATCFSVAPVAAAGGATVVVPTLLTLGVG